MLCERFVVYKVLFSVSGTNKERFFPAEATDFNGVLRKDRVIQENGGHRIDFCKDVAHQTGGAVFDTTHVNSKGATQRLFVKVALTLMAPSFIKVPPLGL